MIISLELGFVSPESAEPALHTIEELQKMLSSLRHKLPTRH